MADRLSAHLTPGEPVLFRTRKPTLRRIGTSLATGLLTATCFLGIGWLLDSETFDIASAASTGVAIAFLGLWSAFRDQATLVAITDRRLILVGAGADVEVQEMKLGEIDHIVFEGAQGMPVVCGRDGSRLSLAGLPEAQTVLKRLQRFTAVSSRHEFPARIRRANSVFFGVGLATGIGAILAPYVLWPEATSALFDRLPTAASLTIILLLYVPSLPATLLLGMAVGGFASIVALRFFLTPDEMKQLLALDIDWQDPGLQHRINRGFVAILEVAVSLLYGERIRADRPPG